MFVCIFACIAAGLAQTNLTENAKRTEEKITIFPNPATNVINVLGLKNTRNAIILISDLYGTTLLNHQWEIKNNALNIPVANLEGGIYLLSIQSEEQNIKTKFYKK